jgi:hypothetical protein
MNLSRSILTQFLNVSGRVNTNDIPSFSAGMSRWCSQQDPSRDKLFKSIKIEVRGHDSAVLDSYTIFLRVSLWPTVLVHR